MPSPIELSQEDLQNARTALRNSEELIGEAPEVYHAGIYASQAIAYALIVLADLQIDREIAADQAKEEPFESPF